MNKFFKDYAGLSKKTNNICKGHWKSVIIMNVVINGTYVAYFCKDEIKDKIKNKFHKEKSEEEA